MICLLISMVCFRLAAQEEEPAPARDLKSVSIGFTMDNLSASAVGLRAGIDLEEFVSLGVLWDMGFTREGGEPATELAVGVWTDAVLLSEDNSLPISFVIRGEFLKKRFLSSYLEENDLIKSGTGYLLGASISRRFTLSGSSALNAAVRAWYRFDTYTLEKEAGSGITFDTQITPSTDYFYGIAAAYEMTLAENIALAVGLKAHLNSELHLFYGPELHFITW